MTRVLILTAGFGEGHNAAARNLAAAVDAASGAGTAQVADLFALASPRLNRITRYGYLTLINRAPRLWSTCYGWADRPGTFPRHLWFLRKELRALVRLLECEPPRAVCSTFPVYGFLAERLSQRSVLRAPHFNIVTDSISINSLWTRPACAGWFVPNPETAEVVRRMGVPADRLYEYGFPVQPFFAEHAGQLAPPDLATSARPAVLYIIHSGVRSAEATAGALLACTDWSLTFAVGRDEHLRRRLEKAAAGRAHPTAIMSWTHQIPRLLMTHHAVISKAGGATTQEAIAARCPMIINQVIPGQEEGNARLVKKLGFGAVAEKSKEVSELIESVFAHRSRKWQEWRDNLDRASRPDAALRIAELVLDQANHVHDRPVPLRLFETVPGLCRGQTTGETGAAQVLLCDFHIHTNYSDGRLTLPEVIDFYGRRGFDCICITDHVADPRRLTGKFSELLNFTIAGSQFDEYFEMLERERRRAWRKYDMLVLAGLEFNKEGLTKKTSGHLLGIDLQAPISPSLDLVEIVAQIHSQGGLAVASRPHVRKSEWGRNTLFLWENQEVFAPIIDAWEIANRNSILTPIGLKRFAFLANSDFHKPKHLYSWKTLLHCEKDPEAIKDCIRQNERVSLTLYRDGMTGEALRAGPVASELMSLRPALPAIPA